MYFLCQAFRESPSVRAMLRLPSIRPNLVPVSLRERLRVALGVFLGLAVTTGIGLTVMGFGPELPLMMAPAGASAVLLFAAPASPLAQPWSILGGNVLAALVGIACAQAIGEVALAAPLAVAISVVLMLTLRCLHPPGGAVALTAVIGGPAITGLGYGFALWPVAANSLALLIVAIAFHRLTGRAYPIPAPGAAAPQKAGAPGAPGLGVTVADLEAAIRERDEVISVDPGDLEQMLHRAEALAFARRSGGVTAGAIMTGAVVTVGPGTSLRVALRLLRANAIKALPVVDAERRVVGILTQTDLVDKADWGPRPEAEGGTGRLGALMRPLARADRPLRGKVREAMTPMVSSVAPDLPIAHVVRLMVETGHHHLPVAGPDGRLLGMVTQSDVVAAFFHANFHDTAPETSHTA